MLRSDDKSKKCEILLINICRNRRRIGEMPILRETCVARDCTRNVLHQRRRQIGSTVPTLKGPTPEVPFNGGSQYMTICQLSNIGLLRMSYDMWTSVQRERSCERGPQRWKISGSFSLWLSFHAHPVAADTVKMTKRDIAGKLEPHCAAGDARWLSKKVKKKKGKWEKHRTS